MLVKQLTLLLLSCLLATAGHAQRYDKTEYCGTDTIRVRGLDRRFARAVDYLAIQCTRVGEWGVRVEWGYASPIYNGTTQQWLGSHASMPLGLAFSYGNFNLGVRAKPSLMQPRSDIVIDGQVLDKEMRVNPAKIDIYAGYTFNLGANFSFEPYAGITRHSCEVYDEEKFNKHFSLSPFTGLHAGATINKYFRLRDVQHLGVFAGYSYGWAKFEKWQPTLEGNYSEWMVGVVFKAVEKRRYYRRVR